MSFHEKVEGYYIGCLKECRKCIIRRGDKDTYLVSQVKLDSNSLRTKDEGFDIKTNAKVWGSDNGFLEFEKIS